MLNVIRFYLDYRICTQLDAPHNAKLHNSAASYVTQSAKNGKACQRCWLL